MPTGLSISAVTQTSIALSWNASTDNLAVVGYGLYANGTKVGTTTAASGAIPGLTCGTSYTVGVDAYDAAGNRSDQATAVVATGACYDTSPPGAPSGIVQTAVTGSSATVSWQPATDDVGVVGYGAYRGGLQVAQTSETSYTFTGLACGASAAVAIDAADAAGNRSAKTPFVVTTGSCGDTQPPTASTGLSETGSTETSISVAWNPSSDNVGVAGYTVSVNGAGGGSTPQTRYTVAGLACGTGYGVSVSAFDAAGNRSASTTAILSTSPCPPPPPPPPSVGDTQPPSPPHGLALSVATQTSVTLAWSASTDNVGVTGYGAYLGGERIGTTSSTSYTFTGLACGTSYTVGVDAYDAAGNGSAQAAATVSTSPCTDTRPPSQPASLAMAGRTSMSISLTWSAASDDVGVAGYGLYRSGARVGTTSQQTYTFTGLTCNTSYTLGVDAYDGSGNRSAPSTVLVATSACGDTQPPSAPSGVTGSGATQASVDVSWNVSTDNVGVAGYDVFAGGTKVASTGGTSFTVTGLTCGTSYLLGVEAYDGAGNRSARSSATAATAACASQQAAASVWLSPAGNDATCARADSSKPCATFDRAYHLARPGDTVSVAAGTYAADDPQSGLTEIRWDESKRSAGSDVSFACQGNGDVSFSSPGFLIRAAHLRLQGSCFRFHVVYLSWSGDTVRNASYLTLDSVHMESFASAGSEHATISNSEIGPNVNCWAQGTSGSGANGGPITPAMWCDPASPVEAFWAARGNADQQMEPFVHANYAGDTTDFTLEGNWIHDIQTKDAANLHTGGLLLMQAGADNLVLRANRFERNAVYDLEADPSPSGVTLENNWFGSAVEPLSSGQGASATLARAEVENVLRSGGQLCFSDWLVRFNSFAHGYAPNETGAPGSCWANVRVIGNIIGSWGCAAGQPGISYDANAVVGAVCGQSSVELASFPYVALEGAIDFHLSGGAAIDLVKQSGGDYSLGQDEDGQGRPMGAGRDAGADEVPVNDSIPSVAGLDDVRVASQRDAP